MKRSEDNDLPRIRTTCRHGLPKLISAERWLRLGESETARTDPAVVGGLAFVQGRLCVLYFSTGVYRAIPVASLRNETTRKSLEALLSPQDVVVVDEYARREAAGEWKQKADAEWREHQLNNSYVTGF